MLALLSLMSFTAVSNFDERVLYSVEPISLEQIDVFIDQKNMSCVGATYCLDGRLLRCETYGENCTFYVQPAVAVRCTGYNTWGQWVDLVGRCF